MIASKKAQMTIFFLVAIVLIATIAVLFIFQNKSLPTIYRTQSENPRVYIEKCARESAEEAINLLAAQGGFLEPQNYKLYEGKKIEYLCENEGYFEPCINQHPILINEIKKEIYNYSYSTVDKCFSDMKDKLIEKGIESEIGKMNMSVEIIPGRVRINVDREFKIKNKESTEIADNFDSEIASPLYELIMVANEIASQEAKYCYFEYVGYMLIYPNFDIKKTSLSDLTKIYKIKEIKSDKELNIAIRGCAVPAGV